MSWWSWLGYSVPAVAVAAGGHLIFGGSWARATVVGVVVLAGLALGRGFMNGPKGNVR